MLPSSKDKRVSASRRNWRCRCFLRERWIGYWPRLVAADGQYSRPGLLQLDLLLGGRESTTFYGSRTVSNPMMGRWEGAGGVRGVMYTHRAGAKMRRCVVGGDQTTPTTVAVLSWAQGFGSPMAPMRLYERGNYTSGPCPSLGSSSGVRCGEEEEVDRGGATAGGDGSGREGLGSGATGGHVLCTLQSRESRLQHCNLEHCVPLVLSCSTVTGGKSTESLAGGAGARAPARWPRMATLLLFRNLRQPEEAIPLAVGWRARPVSRVAPVCTPERGPLYCRETK